MQEPDKISIYRKTSTLKDNYKQTQCCCIALSNKKAHGLKAQPLKDFILGSTPSVNRKLLTHILTNVNTYPAT